MRKRRVGPSSDYAAREPSVVVESVERRTDVRGPVRDLVVALPGGADAKVLEAGRRGVFIALDDPDQYALGARLDVTIKDGARKARGKVEVVRKEIDPRRGVALLIVHMSPTAAADYENMLVP